MLKFDDSNTDSSLQELRIQGEERVVQATAPQLGFEYVDLHTITPNPEAIGVIKEEVAREAMAVGFQLLQGTLSVAVRNPNSPATQQLFKDLETRKIKTRVYMCSEDSLNHLWVRYKDIVGHTNQTKGVLSVDPEKIQKALSSISQKSDIETLLSNIRTENGSHRVSETVSLIFAGALSLKASDIHIEPEMANVRVRYRLDGVLNDVTNLDHGVFKRLMSRLKLLSGMVLNVKAEAQDGRFTFDSGERKVEVRVSIIPSANGESIVMRILDPTVASFSMDKINLNIHIEKAIREQLKKPSGLIITTGPTGSGKTTALYSFLREINDEGRKVITIENPVEYQIKGINHTQTSENYSFSDGLRAILRQDPDVIMVGEIRDREVAETAFHAAQTGHLVFTTLHTNSAVGGFSRLIDLGVNSQVMGTSINLILGQRLVRLLCNDCKVPYQASSAEKELILFVMSTHPFPIQVLDNVNLFRSAGCSLCSGTGFKGRNGIYEGIIMDDIVEEAVLRDPREVTILEAAKPQKLPTMLHDGMEKVLSGLTSLPELERVVEFPTSYQNTRSQTL